MIFIFEEILLSHDCGQMALSFTHSFVLVGIKAAFFFF